MCSLPGRGRKFLRVYGVVFGTRILWLHRTEVYHSYTAFLPGDKTSTPSYICDLELLLAVYGADFIVPTRLVLPCHSEAINLM